MTRTIRAGRIGIPEARERLGKAVREHQDQVERILRKHGAIIEAKAAQITPVDTGFLRRANAYNVDRDGSALVLTIENRMVYARWQHDYPHNHTQPNARDHFIALPFGAELPEIVTDIISTDMEAVQ